MQKLNKAWLKSLQKKVPHYFKASFWFFVGFSIASLTLISLIIAFFQLAYKDRVIPGIFVDNIYVGEKTQKQIEDIYEKKNQSIKDSQFTFTYNELQATVSAQTLDIGYNSKLIAQQTIDLGKSSNFFSNFFLIANSYLNGTTIHSSYKFQTDTLASTLAPIQKEVHVDPVDALFTVENNRVSAFKESVDGQDIDMDRVKNFVVERVPVIIQNEKSQTFSMEIPIAITKPTTTTEEANSFGIVEKIGQGDSYFHHSIPNRIYNVNLAQSKFKGLLIPPGDVVSFNQVLGDVSAFTGYKSAYVIKDGKTVLGDGGGVCQVSTTLFRAVLSAGLPVIERKAHAYRVGYYEQGFGPGLDATVYSPTTDFKFKNDTEKYLLIQPTIDLSNLSLTFEIYGTSDGRVSTVSKPIITSSSAPADDLYVDDPTLPLGTIKQIEHRAYGAKVIFDYKVIRNGETLINQKFVSVYRPWQAVYLKGTAI